MYFSRKQHEENLRKYIELCNKGTNYVEMAKIIGVTTQTISEYKKKTGVEKRVISQEEKEKLFKELYYTGLSTREISNALGISIRDVASYKYKLGITEIKNTGNFNNLEYLENLYNNLDTITNAHKSFKI